MSDIFLSNTTADNAKGAKLASAFEAQGWVVWLDLMCAPARPFTTRNDELERAKVFVVLWSREARESAVVAGVLDFASRRKLPVVAVLLDGVKFPRRFSPNAVFDFSDWYRSLRSQTVMHGMPALLERVGTLVEKLRRHEAPPASFADAPRPESGDERPPQEKQAAPPEDGKRFEVVFISYRRSEAVAYAGRLYDRLAARFGKDKVFFDHENVGWGEDFVEIITEAAESCAVMIVLVSPRWSRGADAEVDDYVRLEVATALGRKIRVVPILIQGAQMPAAKELPEDLAPLVRRNALALSDTRWERDVEDLMKNLEGFLKD